MDARGSAIRIQLLITNRGIKYETPDVHSTAVKVGGSLDKTASTSQELRITEGVRAAAILQARMHQP